MTELPVTDSSRPAPVAPRPSIWAMYRAMVGIGLGCGLAIVTVFELTKPIIARNRAEALRAAIFRVLEGGQTSQAFVQQPDGSFAVADQAAAGDVVHAAYDGDGRLLGIAIEAAGMGYQDVIRVLYGYSPERDAIVGFSVLESKETPGLGDKIETDPGFLANFEALDTTLNPDGDTLRNAIVFRKQGEKQNPWEVDGITGATISSHAIADLLNASAAHWVPRIEAHLSDFEQRN